MPWTYDPDGWSRSLGRAWGVALRDSAIDAAGVVVEIGPGFTAKVGLGLLESNFQGTVVLVEPNRQARSWAQQRYGELLPGVEVLVSEDAVPTPTRGVPRPVDVLAANHILDDLLLDACLSPSEREYMFAEMRPERSCSPTLIRTWRDLVDAPLLLETAAHRVVSHLVEYISRLQPRVVLLNQYSSWRHVDAGLGALGDYGLAMMLSLAKNLDVTDRAVCFRIFEGENAVTWLVSHRATEMGNVTHDVG